MAQCFRTWPGSDNRCTNIWHHASDYHMNEDRCDFLQFETTWLRFFYLTTRYRSVLASPADQRISMETDAGLLIHFHLDLQLCFRLCTDISHRNRRLEHVLQIPCPKYECQFAETVVAEVALHRLVMKPSRAAKTDVSKVTTTLAQSTANLNSFEYCTFG